MSNPRGFERFEWALAPIVCGLAVVLFFGKELAHGVNLFEYTANDRAYYFDVYPMVFKNQLLLGQGYFPLWWHNASLGLPALGAWLSAPFYPILLLFTSRDFLESANLYLLIRVWLMACFAYLFARKSLSLSPAAAGMAAATFAFSGFTLGRLVTNDINAAWSIPLMAYALDRQVRGPKWGMIAIGAFAGASALLSGHPPQAFYVFFFGGSWWLYRWAVDEQPNSGGATALMATFALALLVTAVQLVPGAEIIAQYMSHHPEDTAIASYQGMGFFSFIMPWLTGTRLDNFLTSLLMPYMGVIPVFLVLFGLTRLRKIGRHGGFLSVYILLFFGLAHNLPLFRMWQDLPVFNRLANQVTAMASASLCIGLLAGMALDYALRDAAALKALGKFLFFALVPVIAISIYGQWLLSYIMAYKEFKAILADAAMLQDDWVEQTAVAAALVLSAATTITLVSSGKLKKTASAWLIVIIASAGLWADHLGWDLQDPGAYSRLRKSAMMQEFSKHIASSENSPARMTSDIIPANLLWLLDFQDIRSASTFQPARYYYLMARLNGLDMEKSREDFRKFARIIEQNWYAPFPIEKMGSPVGKLLGIRYGLALKPEAKFDYPVLMSGDEGTIYENPSVMPRAFLAEGYRIFRTARNVLDFVLTAPPDWERSALFAEEDFPVTEPWREMPDSVDASAAKVGFKFYRDQESELAVNAPSKAFLIMTDLYAPGWRATINGKDARIWKADYLVRAVAVPEGASVVRFSYEPPSFAIGLWATVTTIVFFVFVFGSAHLIKGKKAVRP